MYTIIQYYRHTILLTSRIHISSMILVYTVDRPTLNRSEIY